MRRAAGGLAGRYRRPDGHAETVDAEPGETEDDLWTRLRATALHDPARFGYDGAIGRFLDVFPEGFEDPAYLEAERDYKVEAADLLAATAPVARAATGTGYAESIVRVCLRTNLVDPRWERPALVAALSGPDGDSLVRHIASFALGDSSRLAAIAAVCGRNKVRQMAGRRLAPVPLAD